MERETSQPVHGGHTGDIPKNSVLIEYDESKISSARITELTYWLNAGDHHTPERNIIFDVGETESAYITDYSTYLDNLILHTPEGTKRAQTAIELQINLLDIEEQLTDNLSKFMEIENFEGALELLFSQKVVPPRLLLMTPDSFESAPSNEVVYGNDLDNKTIEDTYDTLVNIIGSGDFNRAMCFAIRESERISELSLASMCVDWNNSVLDLIEGEPIPESHIQEQTKFRDILALYCTLIGRYEIENAVQANQE